MTKTAIIICGPTASGKTEYALKLAKQCKGQVINADSMQIYKQIPNVTSSPTIEFQSELKHHLYNFLDIKEEYSAIKYANAAAQIINQVHGEGALPIIVGGSGLYISSLVKGYNQIPDISQEVRSYTRNLYIEIGADKFWEKLIKLDPLVYMQLPSSDKQRILRAFEVIIQTGESIFSFMQKSNFIPLSNFQFKILFLMPKRELLYDNCNNRVKLYLDSWIEEISSIKDQIENCQSSASKALGVQEILSYLNNNITYQQLLDLISINTRHFAKRQITWFKNQIKDKETIEYSSKTEFEKILLSSI